jgi:WD40 repeat protein
MKALAACLALFSACAAVSFGQTLHPEAKLDAPVAIHDAIVCGGGAQFFGIGEDGAIYRWTPPATKPIKFTITDGKVQTIDCAQGHTLAASIRQGKVLILDSASGEVRQSIDPAAPVQALALSPDGSLLAIATSLLPTQLFDTHSGQHIATGVTNIGATWTVAFSPTGDTFVAADEDTNLRAYNRDGKLLYAADGGLLEPFALAFSGDGKRFAAAGADGIIRVFDTASGKMAASSKKLGRPVFGLSMSPDGMEVAALTADDFELRPVTLGVWNVRSQDFKPLDVDPKSCIGAGANKSHILMVTRDGEKTLQVSSVQ